MNNKGLTLIELMVTAVIIGLLLAFIAPVFGKAREAARRAQCANNLRQIGIAWQLYLDDHNESFPALGRVSSVTFGGKGNRQLSAEERPLNPYLNVFSDADKQALELFRCPSERPVQRYGRTYTYYDLNGTSYATNPKIISFLSADKKSWLSRPLSSITVPHSKLWLAKDYSNYHGGTLWNCRVNVVFLDGHIGMHTYWNDFDIGNNNPSKPVYEYPTR